ncbi:MAG: glycosyltransferase family 2 protein [Acidobacteria bacterium]|nr:glycosyltransferase family 2 protein [Acidobacteriota bacterium]MYD70078.1 glycosyltransferase family 2 protein [Acidobacteriota bacterium]MYJ04891.1 glycosyltransferase family 2 protein [Acidobacteriota bacterium]
MPSLSVVIITRDEAANIRDALASVAWADERVVVDSGSTDETVRMAREAGARVETHPWEGYAAQKNHATTLAANDWILSLDADERVTPALAEEIRAMLAAPPQLHGYRIPRVTRYLGRWIRSTDWYPDPQLRLYDRRHARWRDVLVHESVALDSPAGRLRSELEHHPYRDIAHHLRTIDRYTTLAAQQMRKDGRRAVVSDLALQAPAAFIRNYLLRAGVRDGATGLLVSMLNSYYVFLKFAKLWELQQRWADRT